MPNRNQVWVPGGILRLQQRHWIRTIRCRHKTIMGIWWCSRPRVLTVRSPLSNVWVCDLPSSHMIASPTVNLAASGVSRRLTYQA